MMPGRVLVTGATGFIGSHLCRQLVARGLAVRAVVRSGSGPVPAGSEPVVVEDLTDRAAVRQALRDVDSVVHLAARVHVMRETAIDPREAFWRVNVEGTRVLIEEAAQNSVGRFLLASTVKAVGEGNERRWDDFTAPRPVDPYGESKLEAEEVVRRLAAEAGLHAPILRFPLVYGPGMKGNMFRLFQLVDRGVPLPFGAVRNRRSMVYVGNVVNAIVAALAASSVRSETLFISDGVDLSTPELIRGIGRALGRPARLVPVPAVALRTAGRVGDLIARMADFPFTSDAVTRLVDSLSVDSRRFGALTGFRAAFSVDEGLGRTAAWYRSELANRAAMRSRDDRRRSH